MLTAHDRALGNIETSLDCAYHAFGLSRYARRFFSQERHARDASLYSVCPLQFVPAAETARRTDEIMAQRAQSHAESNL